MLISLAQWAELHGRTSVAARQLIRRGKLPEALKIGRNYIIESTTQWPDDRRFKLKEGSVMKQYETIIKQIVRSQGGYREKNVMSNPHTYEQSETWNDEHKVINVYESESQGGHRDGFSVDIVTKSICG